MAYIEERPGVKGSTWRAYVRMKGHPTVAKTFKSKTRAKDWARSKEAAIKEGRETVDTREARKHSVADLVDRYMADLAPNKKRAAHLAWWRAKVGHLTLSDLRPDVIAEWRDRLGRGESLSGEKASPATRVRYLAALSHACRIAVRELRWLDRNPCRDVTRPTEPKGRVRYLSNEERDRLLVACQASPEPRLYPLVLLALSTGGREGELLGLTWRALDLERALATLEDTKNGERRALPITGKALDVMLAYRGDRKDDDALVFAGPSGRAAFPVKAWNAALTAANVTGYRFHDNRHTFASWLIMSGATLAEVAEALGHKTLAMVKRYAHISPEHTVRVVARMTGQWLS